MVTATSVPRFQGSLERRGILQLFRPFTVSELCLKLFVAGDSSRARDAAANLARACAAIAGAQARIETVDILRDPAAADEYRVLTTPTVVRVSPAPRRRVTGDFRDIAQVLLALDLHPMAAQ